MSYAASDATQEQNPGLTDNAVQTGTNTLDRAEDREVGLGSSPGITDKATKQMHQGMDAATGEGPTKTTSGESKGVADQISETVGGLVDKVTESMKK